MKNITVVLLFWFSISCFGVFSSQTLFAQDKTPEQQMDEFKKQNKIRSLETLIPSKRKDVDMRYAKKEISRDWDKKTKEMKQTEVQNIKCPILYEKAAILAYNHFLKEFKDDKVAESKIKKGESILKFLEKLIALYQKDVKSLEKSLKKDEDPQSILDKVMEYSE